ncbi:hypothetical protein SAMN02745133_00279 [Desulforamulus putei DSM 12395]|uniref:Uncharacterized protein n=1 Tax=Desulforamulus putei DSM 12395 TaxID=1121429 RepID=A0A1M4SY72_9FIRM|nr:hypothetical protein [Desulforamulus putei]SHE37120.1 hypothetical protein SAMN02745133_00279 [Desulforamulus putei DSM 12395]
MHYVIYTLLDWGLIYFFVGKRFFLLWKAALIGLAIAVIVDYFGIKYNLYYYTKGYVYIGKQPVFALINVFANVILYMNWLPRQWHKRFLYTAYVSVLLLAVEAAMYRAGAIQYPNWQLWYSYFLLNAGLLLVAFLSDLLKVTPPTKLT